MAKAKRVAKNCNPPGKSATSVYDAMATKMPWFKQGYLMVKSDQVVGPLRDKHNQSGYIKNLSIPKKTGTSLVNLLTVSPEILSFFNGSSLDYSQLVPHVEIRKVYISKETGGIKNIQEIVFPFGSLTDWNAMSEAIKKSGRLFRGKEAGIQQVDMKMEGRGRNPVSSNVLDITVKYFFNDVKTLFEPLGERLKVSNREVTFADLIRFPAWRMSTEDFSRRSFRIRLVLGWNMNPDVRGKVPLPDGFEDAVEQSKISIAADLYTHSMEFNEDGSLVLTAKYKGALESAFSDADIMAAGVAAGEKDPTLGEIKRKIRALEDQYVSNGFRHKGWAQKYNDILRIEREIENLTRIRESIVSKGKVEGDYPEAVQAYKALRKAYHLYDEVKLQAKKKGAFSTLQKATQRRGTSILDQSELEKRNAAKIAALKKRYEKYGKRRSKRRFRKAIQKLRAQLKKYQKEIKGKYVFSYVEKLQEQNKLAWISTGRGSYFSNYAALLEGLRKYGDARDQKSKDKLKKLRKKAEQDNKRVPISGPEAAYLAGVGALSATMRMAGTPFAAGTLAEVAMEHLQSGNIRSSKSRRTTEYGDAILWENVPKPKYKKGSKTYFFRLGDLLTVILENGNFGKRLEEDAPNFKLLLGEYDIPHRDGEDLTRVSLYDLPISLEIFHVFVAQKIVGTGRAVYPLLQFTFDLIKFVMDKTQNVFGKTAEFDLEEISPVHFKMDMSSLDLPTKQIDKLTKGGTLDTIRIAGIGGDEKTSGLSTLAVDSIKNTSSTFVLHAQRRLSSTESSIAYDGNMKEDEKRGIFHFFVGGPSRGIMKKINFTQAGNSLFSMALMRNGQDGGMKSSREGIIQPSKFTCELTLVGNPFFYIGQMFYVNTDLISGGHFKENGILNGGYYIVTEVTNNFRSDRWETKIRGVLNVPDHALKKFKGAKPGALAEKLKDQPPKTRDHLKDLAKKAKSEAKAAATAVSEKTRRDQGISKYYIDSRDGNCYEQDKKGKTIGRRHKDRCKGGGS